MGWWTVNFGNHGELWMVFELGSDGSEEGKQTQVQIPALSFAGCVILRKCPDLSEPN